MCASSRRTVAFWDVDNCGLPSECSGEGLRRKIIDALRGGGIECSERPCDFTIYLTGNTDSFNKQKKKRVHESANVIETNIPTGTKSLSLSSTYIIYRFPGRKRSSVDRTGV